MTLEICVDSLDSILACTEAGADRIELCASLTEGGLTPSAGTLVQARALFPGEIAMMIRPRGGDFVYQPEEIAAMCADIELARDLGADAVVFGCLAPDGALDLVGIETLLDACDGFPAVFHRAFDVCAELPDALETLVEFGFERVLTSGGAPSAMDALDLIAILVEQAGDRLDILPGGGIKAGDVAEVIRRTGANQVHLSARSVQESLMTFRRPEIPMGALTVPGEYERLVADAALITTARAAMG
ncbi:MAG TPA: copper homeostasis protein CutC [Haloferula sp.]